MFSRNKRKREEQDDQLVPHGFLWQATDEIAPSEAPLPVAPPPKPVEVKPPVEIPRRIVTDARPPAQTVSISDQPSDPKLGAISPPLQWPSPNIQGVRRTQVPATPIATSPVPAATLLPAPLAREAARPKLEVVNRRERRPWIRPAIARSRQAITRTTTQLRLAGARSSQQIILIATSLRKKLQSVEIGNRASRLLTDAGQRSSSFLQKATPAARAAVSQMRKVSAGAAQASTTARRNLGRSYPTVEFKKAGAFLKRAWDFKLTIRIPRATATRQVPAASTVTAPWRVFRLRRVHDSRLWASLGMAGLSALLALALVSTVRHYGEANLPSRVFAQSESKTDSAGSAPLVQPAAVIEPSKPAPTVGVELRNPHRSRALAQDANHARPAVRIKATVRPAARPKRRKPHYNADDDYVARDTTVYYGNAGKPSR